MTVVGTLTRRDRSMRDSIWSNTRIRWVVATTLAIAAALVSAWLTPRGPVTTPQALTTMAAAVAVGLGVGLVTRSRWSVVVTPTVFIVVFEIARLGLTGPTVDTIQLGSMYGMLAFVLGRGVHGLLVLLPMTLGVLFGVEIAARLGRPDASRMGIAGWIVTGLLTVAVGALAVAIAPPPSTAPIAGPGGTPQPGSIAELATVRIGGHDQGLMIRGRSVDSPVLLYLAGGPGGTDLGAMRRDTALEAEYVVVTWDQRGVGKSYASLDPVTTLTVDRMVADTLELTNYLRDRFEEERIYLVGNSWGTILSVVAAQQHPELYHAIVGTGQMVSVAETDRMFWEDALAWAERSGNAELVATLRENGPPPYADLLKYEAAVGHEHEWNPYPELDLDNEMPAILFVPEYSLMDKINGFRSFLDTFSVLYPQLQEIDFRRDAVSLQVPVYMVVGAHEARGRAVPANEWFEMLQAPTKERIVFEHSGHRPQFDEPAAFAALMSRVLDETSGAVASDSAAE